MLQRKKAYGILDFFFPVGDSDHKRACPDSERLLNMWPPTTHIATMYREQEEIPYARQAKSVPLCNILLLLLVIRYTYVLFVTQSDM
jgi:hypothetical protein